MNITLVGPVYPYRGGIAHYTAQLARSLAALGHSTRVISFRRQYPAWLYPGDSDKDPSQQPMRTDAEYLLDPLYPWTWCSAARYILSGQPDLVVIQWWTTFWAIPFAFLSSFLRRKGLMVIYVIHNVLPHETRPWDAWLARLALRAAQGFVAQTNREKERLLALVPNAVVNVCPLPAYALFSKDMLSKLEARKRLKLPEKQAVLLFFGIVRPYKGLRYLIEAIALLRDAGKSPILLVAGDFWEDLSIYTAQIEQLKLGEQIRLDDRYIPDEEAAVMFAAADMLVAPYIEGTQSAAAGMAMGCGLPMVVTEVVAEGIAENNKKTVRVVPPRNPASLAEAISQFLENPPEINSEPDYTDGWTQLVQTLVDLEEQIRDRLKDSS